ncbi:MAG: hypothetical protein CMJ31_06385 [Phycisphaerae bacterium]|nr:hypothetical protein [Phycisphaerae bacterium]
MSTIPTRQQVLGTFAMTMDQAKKLVADVPDDRFAELPFEGAKHPGWVLGHLCCGAGMGAAFLAGEEGVAGCPDAWVTACMPGTQLAADRSAYGAKADLLTHFERVHGLLADRYGAASDDLLATEFPNPEYRSFFPTLGDACFYLMAYHEGYHLGQLSAWRRAAGFGPVD